ncbi:MAG: DUF3857 and transglutaminase domain-containing protein [Acidobacteriota bacterium]|nr:MAG: DUF3857 and transglutaminase domain-containing protein [Acidobacteriota bacterium]
MNTAVFAADPPDWKPVTKAELEMTTPQVEPGADAEAIFWEVTLDDTNPGNFKTTRYARIKLFTERGVEQHATFRVTDSWLRDIEDLAGRITLPDGTSREISKDDIFEQVASRTTRSRVKSYSFAFPGIRPGAVIEVRYTEDGVGSTLDGRDFPIQLPIPAQRLTIFLKTRGGRSVFTRSYNTETKLEFRQYQGDEDLLVLDRRNVPAFREEPFMPPTDEVRQWVFIEYSKDGEDFDWSAYAGRFTAGFDRRTTPRGKVKRTAREIVGSETDDLKKLEKLYNFVQKEIRNHDFDDSEELPGRSSYRGRTPDDVIGYKAGLAPEINYTFAALARALDFEVRMARTGDRSKLFFHPEFHKSSEFVRDWFIAVKVGEDWHYFDPAVPYLPAGIVHWKNLNVNGMLIDKKTYIWTSIQFPPANRTKVSRKGSFRIDEKGDLRGTVRLEFTGQAAIDRREALWWKTFEGRIATVEASFEARTGTVEVSNVKIENIKDNTLPLVYEFDLAIPRFAQQAGSRMFFQPSVFEYGIAPVFTSAERRHAIHFRYPWTEEDEIEIEYPEGYSTDLSDWPAEVEDRSGVSGLNISVIPDKAAPKLEVSRRFRFGDRSIIFSADAYPQLKKLFDTFSLTDGKMVLLEKR